MPQFSVLPVGEAVKKAETSGMSDNLAEYVEYLNGLAEGEAGRLTPSDGEDVRTVRMRLGRYTPAQAGRPDSHVEALERLLASWANETPWAEKPVAGGS